MPKDVTGRWRRPEALPQRPTTQVQQDGVSRPERGQRLERDALAILQENLIERVTLVLGLRRWERAAVAGLPPAHYPNLKALGRALLRDADAALYRPYQWRSGARTMSRQVLERLLEMLVSEAESLYQEREELRGSWGLEVRPLVTPLVPVARSGRPGPPGLHRQKYLLARAAAFIPSWTSRDSGGLKLQPFKLARHVLGRDDPQSRGRGYEWLARGVRANGRYRPVDRISLLTIDEIIVGVCERLQAQVHKLRGEVSDTLDAPVHLGYAFQVLCGTPYHSRLHLVRTTQQTNCGDCCSKVYHLPANRIEFANCRPIHRSVPWEKRNAMGEEEDSPTLHPSS